jgi:hypothetical protein
VDEAARRARKDPEEYAEAMLDFDEERKFDLDFFDALASAD